MVEAILVGVSLIVESFGRPEIVSRLECHVLHLSDNPVSYRFPTGVLGKDVIGATDSRLFVRLLETFNKLLSECHASSPSTHVLLLPSAFSAVLATILSTTS